MPLYPYQKRVKELIHGGKSVILQAPTGAGKTRAALAPFIEAFFDHPPSFFPRKCIYSVPMKVLANQFLAEYENLTDKYQRKYRRKRRLHVSIQTGDQPDDRKVESNLVFTTIDQTLSNYLSVAYGVGNRLANINAGAVLSSYLVFDELHLFDPDSTLPTTLAMLAELKEITPFIVMTATFSLQMINRLAVLLDAAVVPGNQDARFAMEKIGSQVNKDRRFHAVDSPLTAERVLQSQGTRTVCICNTVARAQQLYQDIKKELTRRGEEKIELTLLHSRFYKNHRDKKEEQIKTQFGPSQEEYQGPKRILIATQVIEVGLDITCDVMHTEIAPAASLLQRSGRCARRESEQGNVFVYLPRNEDGDPNFIPYHMPAQKNKNDDKIPPPSKTNRGLRLCQATWEALTSDEYTDTPITFRHEQALIDQVHQAVDQEILDGIAYSQKSHQEKMEDVMRSCDRAQAADLIRDVHSTVFVFLHDDPKHDDNLQHNPWYYDGFSLTAGQLYRILKPLDEGEVHFDGWPMFWAERVDQDSDSPARSRPEYVWNPIQEAGEVYGNFIIAIHPQFVHYSEEMGLWLDERGEKLIKPQVKDSKTNNRGQYAYQLETYSEHVHGLDEAYTQSLFDSEKKYWHLPLNDEIAFSMQRLEEKLEVTSGTMNRMLKALFVLHDLGKLDTRWQKWAHDWQTEISKLHDDDEYHIPESYMAAHTTYDGSKEQKKAQREIQPQRPNHAGESAIAGIEVIKQLCNQNQDVARAAFTAIARHHSPLTSSYSSYQFHTAAVSAIREALQTTRLPETLANHIRLKDSGKEAFKNGLINFSNPTQRKLYFLFARLLRLADQRSQW